MSIFELINIYNNCRSPQKFIEYMINNNPDLKSNEIIKNSINMANNGDEDGLETMAKNLYKEKGVDINPLLNQLSNMLK